MLVKEYPEVTKVVGELKKLSLGERLRMLADEKEKRRKDRLARERYVREEGKEEGRAEGREEGVTEAARKLKAAGLSVEFIAESLKLPLETVEGL
jgi:predicted transposase/invertase (TIGR01784 family)